MTTKEMKALAQKMKGMDYCMMTTVTSYGHLGGRPMSNNREVEYDGTSYFFTWADSRMAHDIEKNKHVQLGFRGDREFLFIAVQGEARILTDRRVMKDHWREELYQWFKDGLDTEGLVMIVVDAKRINWWGEDEGEIDL